MTKQIVVSVIVPVYNVERYLSACLDSLLSQSHPWLEIFCIDDASTDGSFQILQRYCQKYDNIHAMKNFRNQGSSYTRNRGIRCANGKYLCLLDADDALKPGAIERLVDVAESGQTDLVFFDYEQIDEEGRVDAIFSQHMLYEGFQQHAVWSGEEAFLLMMKKLEAIRSPGCGVFIRTSFLRKKHVFFKEGLINEDLMFTTQAIIRAERVSILNEKLYLYRQHPEVTISTSADPLRAQSVFYIFSFFWTKWKKLIPYWSKEMNQAFAHHLRNIFYLYQSYRPIAKQTEPFRYGNEADRFLFDLMESSEITIVNHLTFSNDDWSVMHEAKHIFIYGAGVLGVEAMSQIHGQGLSVATVFVSSLTGNPTELHETEVIVFDRSVVHAGDVLVFAIRPETAGTLLKKLEKELPCAIVKPKVRM